MEMAREYYQGKFKPINPQKYVGDATRIIYRSGWELKCMNFFDKNPNILKWSSEETTVKYMSPVDNEIHTYYIDFTVLYKTRTGEVKKALVEVKPHRQTLPPPVPKRKTKRYLDEVRTYAVNSSKWVAARAWASKNGFEFKILTEHDIGV